MVILHVNNFQELIFKESETAWAVEFYSHWCGHCVRYAPEWKKLATDVKGNLRPITSAIRSWTF